MKIKGEDINISKGVGHACLTAEQVLEIKAKLAEGRSKKGLSEEYGVSRGTIQFHARRVALCGIHQ